MQLGHAYLTRGAFSARCRLDATRPPLAFGCVPSVLIGQARGPIERGRRGCRLNTIVIVDDLAPRRLALRTRSLTMFA